MGETPGATRRRLGVGALVVLVLVTAGVTVAIGAWRTVTAPVDVPAPSASVTASATGSASAAVRESAVYVHVHGAVVVPGLYRLDGDSRVVDAIAAAGGFSESADRAGVNLARPVSDGEQLFVPEPGQQPPSGEVAGPGAAPGAGSSGTIDLNTADATELDTLPRVGPALAERIIAWREENGRFTSVDDLLAVSGIGEKMLEALRDRVRV